MSILVTGAAGFIGYHVCQQLLARGESVIGVDNLNDYYDPALKKARLALLEQHPHFAHHLWDISDPGLIQALASIPNRIDRIVHLAAQAGVRYSLINPHAYVEANVMGQLNILEFCRQYPVEHLVYASSSSVYGANQKLPFSVLDPVDQPISLYAATKRSAELMTHTYSHLFQIPATGLRFFTVYGPWGRPDMAAFIFTKAIINQQPIAVFNQGDMRRNFTYIDDIVSGILGCLDDALTAQPWHRLYNIGNNQSESLMDFIRTLETMIGKKAIIDYQPLQAGDVKETIADIEATTRDFGFRPKTNIDAGLKNFVNWYRSFYERA